MIKPCPLIEMQINNNDEFVMIQDSERKFLVFKVDDLINQLKGI